MTQRVKNLFCIGLENSESNLTEKYVLISKFQVTMTHFREFKMVET